MAEEREKSFKNGNRSTQLGTKRAAFVWDKFYKEIKRDESPAIGIIDTFSPVKVGINDSQIQLTYGKIWIELEQSDIKLLSFWKSGSSSRSSSWNLHKWRK